MLEYAELLAILANSVSVVAEQAVVSSSSWKVEWMSEPARGEGGGDDATRGPAGLFCWCFRSRVIANKLDREGWLSVYLKVIDQARTISQRSASSYPIWLSRMAMARPTPKPSLQKNLQTVRPLHTFSHP
jgi:hypothetical protein